MNKYMKTNWELLTQDATRVRNNYAKKLAVEIERVFILQNFATDEFYLQINLVNTATLFVGLDGKLLGTKGRVIWDW